MLNNQNIKNTRMGKTTGKKVLYPLIEENEYYFGNNDDRGAANYWYKTTGKAIPVSTKSGEVVKLVDDSKNTIDDIYNIQLEENYSRDADGNYKYYKIMVVETMRHHYIELEFYTIIIINI